LTFAVSFRLIRDIDDLLIKENTMRILKLTTTAIVATTLATASFAGTIEPMEEDTMVDMVEETGSSAGSSGGGILLPLLGLAVVAALIASDDS
jgi:hypothetical protein